jgi:clan AA aspartic protease
MLVGVFTASVQVIGPRGGRIIKMCVDSADRFLAISQEMARRLGTTSVGTDEFELADGRIETRPIAEARIRIDGREATTIVVITTGRPLLGAYALEGLRLGIDPVRKRLRPIRGVPA